MTTPRGDFDGCNDDDVGVIDHNMSWGVYGPPSQNNNGLPHGGYVRIVDAKGKSFSCGFSRPIGCVMETVALGGGKKRSRSSDKSEDVQTNISINCKLDVAESCESSEVEQRKRTITEERLHPEEALFLHLRGLLRIVSNDVSGGSDEAREHRKVIDHTTLTTQDLFCSVLKECNIPLAAYLAYAHLRAQGYILIRYTEQRMNLLCWLKLAMKEAMQTNGSDFDAATSQMNDTKERYKKSRTLRLQLSDDVATAPPPCVVTSLDENDIRLAYYAYNPNAHFKRSNPGLPDFGVAVMPFNNSQPTFDTLSSLVSMCEGADDSDINTKSGIPLRIVTVADGGAVIAFGVTNGEVPRINHSDKDA